MFGLKVLTFLYDSELSRKSESIFDRCWGSESNFGTVLDARLSTRSADVWNHLLTLNLIC